ncbi:MAG: dihydrodipicolinate synthase family protein [Proteobacteria bacterium]|nr:dihydrodipicolinate synthase family protein [Pseudomonadota bacterium]
MFRPKGVITSMVTSFTAEGGLDEAGLRANIRFQREAGVGAVCVLGGTGEPVAMTRAERQRVMAVAMEATEGRLDVVFGAMAGNPDDILADIRAAAGVGAAACMICSPPFVRPAAADVHRFIAETAARSPLPLIIFNVPSRTGFLMSAEFVIRVSREVEAVVGIKESSGDLAQFSRLRAECREGFSMLQGNDPLYLPSLALGGDGGILAAAAAFPELMLEIEAAAAAGAFARVLARQHQVVRLSQLMYQASHPAPLKRAIARRGLAVGRTRPPLYDPAPEHAAALDACVDDILASLGGARRRKAG